MMKESHEKELKWRLDFCSVRIFEFFQTKQNAFLPSEAAGVSARARTNGCDYLIEYQLLQFHVYLARTGMCSTILYQLTKQGTVG